MTQLTDIVGQPAFVGSKIAAGMSYNRSSVLRLGVITKIVEKDEGVFKNWRTGQDEQRTRWSVTVEWTHNGAEVSRYEVKKSTILVYSYYTYAKFLVLPTEWVDQFPSDIVEDKQ